MEESIDRKSLKQQSEGWRENEKTLLELRRCLEGDPRSVRWVFEAAEENRLVFENHLFVRFGVKADTMEVVEGFKPPLSLRGKKDLILLGAFYEFYSDVLEVREEMERRRAEDLAARWISKFGRSFPADGEGSYEKAATKVLALYDEEQGGRPEAAAARKARIVLPLPSMGTLPGFHPRFCQPYLGSCGSGRMMSRLGS
jgi:hypothetical protein